MGHRKLKGKTQYISKGQRRNVNKNLLKSIKQLRSPLDKALDQLNACRNNRHTLLPKDISSKIRRKGAFYV